MKIGIYLFAFLWTSGIRAQTNTFPSSGNVGIGVIPSSWASGTEGALQVKNAGFYGYSTYETGVMTNAYYNLGWKYISTDFANLYQQSAGKHVWSRAVSGTSGTAITWLENMRIDNAGNIGIGTSFPTEKLTVEGNISANGFITTKKLTLTQIGWSDYVFAKRFKLRSLSSLETFIKQNGHLPDLPSAKEVEAKGISVGDNQALLLKKIEELTLYMIDMQKQIKKQAVEIQRLKKKIVHDETEQYNIGK
jgi:hypothetical protein